MDVAKIESLVSWLKENEGFTKEQLLQSALESDFTKEEFEEAWKEYNSKIDETNDTSNQTSKQTDLDHRLESTTSLGNNSNTNSDSNPNSNQNAKSYKPADEHEVVSRDVNTTETNNQQHVNNPSNEDEPQPVSQTNQETIDESSNQSYTTNQTNTTKAFDPSSLNSVKPTPKSKRTLIIVIVSVILLLLLTIGGYFVFRFVKSKANGTDGNNNKAVSAIEEKYKDDSDGDFIPDALEDEIGTDKNTSILDECSKNNCDALSLQNIPKTNILFIIDASGSMSQKIDGKSKMDIAKDAMIQLLNGLDTTNVDIGLMVYGLHGSNSPSQKALSCSKIDLLQPIVSGNKEQVKSSIRNLKATGWTPIEGSLNMALSAFANKTGQNNNVILITDGIEQCGGNPVNAATKLANNNIKVSVIGFGISSSDSKGLSAIASAGNGTYTDAYNGTTLINAIKAKVDNSKAIYEHGKCETDVKASRSKCVTSKYEEALSKINKLMSAESQKNGYKSPRFIEIRKIYDSVLSNSTKLANSLNTDLGNMGKKVKNDILQDRNKTSISSPTNAKTTKSKTPYVSGFK